MQLLVRRVTICVEIKFFARAESCAMRAACSRRASVIATLLYEAHPAAIKAVRDAYPDAHRNEEMVADYRNHGKLADYARCAKCEPRPPPRPPARRASLKYARADGVPDARRARAPTAHQLALAVRKRTRQSIITAVVHTAESRRRARLSANAISLAPRAALDSQLVRNGRNTGHANRNENGHQPHRAQRDREEVRK